MTVRALVVDDSPTMQRLLTAVLEQGDDVRVIGTAHDPYEARDKIKALDPDVITLDIEMPNMNGIDFLRQLMRLRPTPVVVISSHTSRGDALSFEALRLGAVGCLPKPRLDDETALREIRQTVAAAARQADGIAMPLAAMPGGKPVCLAAANAARLPDIIAIGASTGGIEALATVLAAFPADCPPTLVTQHLLARFTPSFATFLNDRVAPRVVEATDGIPLKRGEVYVAPGGAGHLTLAGQRAPYCKIEHSPPERGHRPSVDVMFRSVAALRGVPVAAALLTGMGDDGAHGLLAIKAMGGHTIAQDQASCVVFGMPKAAAKLGAARDVLALGDIAASLLTMGAQGASATPNRIN